jgi:hypothetical protein
MANEVYLLFALLVIAATYVLTRVHGAWRFHGKMLVICPETLKLAAVRVNLARAATASVARHIQMRLRDCSRWPERSGCHQDCRVQVLRDPQGHRVWTIASHWFEGKNCVRCGKRIPPLSHYDHRPAVMGSEKITTQWDEIAAEKLPETFSKVRPVCWSCHMTDTFMREHPDLLVIRPWRKSGPLGKYVPDARLAASVDDRRPSS